MKKSTHRTPRNEISDFEQIKNIGPSLAEDFRRLKLRKPKDLIGKNPLTLYQNICKVDDVFHDPCVLDCFMAAVEFMNGKPPKVWWAYTDSRKKKYSQEIQRLRDQFEV